MTLEEITATLSGFDDIDEAKKWFQVKIPTIVDMILERAEFDTKQIKNIIETIAASLRGRGGKGFIKHQLTFYVGNEIAERAKARTKDHFDKDVQLHKNNAGNAIATIENISRILLAHKHLNIRYDEYSGQVYYEEFGDRHLPWNSQPEGDWFDLQFLNEHDEKQVSRVRFHSATSKYQLAAIRKYLWNFFPEEKHWVALEDSLLYCGMQNKTNIYQEFLSNGLPEWDGKDRMDFLHHYAGLENRDWASVVGHSLFLGMVARCFEPGYDYRGVVVLEGPQNSGKSRLCRLLAFHENFFHQFFFTRNIEGYEVSRQIMGKAIVEFPEMGNITGRDQNYIKQFLSSLDDTNRQMHSNLVERRPRSSVFMITTNDMGRYLSDETGNSRYLPARLLAEIIDLDTIRLILPQLFAQAKYLWDTGKVVPRLEPVELAMQKAMVSTREVRPNYYYWILEKLKLHHRQMDESENYDDGFTMDEMLSWMESEDWYSKSTKAKHRDEIRKALPKYFHIESVHKYIPEIHRINSADSSYTRKWRYKGSIPWIKFLDSLDD